MCPVSQRDKTMVTAKLFEKLSKLIEPPAAADKKHIQELHAVLHKLKKKQKRLQEELLVAEGEHQQRKIKQEIEVIKRQRHKGVDVYKELKRVRAEARKGIKEGESAADL